MLGTKTWSVANNEQAPRASSLALSDAATRAARLARSCVIVGPRVRGSSRQPVPASWRSRAESSSSWLLSAVSLARASLELVPASFTYELVCHVAACV